MDPCFGVTIPTLSRGPSPRKSTRIWMMLAHSTVSTTDCKDYQTRSRLFINISWEKKKRSWHLRLRAFVVAVLIIY